MNTHANTHTRTWYWVRHGPTHQNVMTGWRDVPADLSDTAALGRLQTWLPRASVISSDLVRAGDTATAICGQRPRLKDDSGLREIDFGRWDGMHWSDIAQKDPDLSRRYWQQPGDIRAPDGESWNDAAYRVDLAARRLSRVQGDLIIVAHMGVILTRIQRALKCPAYQALAHKIAPLSVTVINETGGDMQVRDIGLVV